jgi:hypothetical protein
VRRCVACHLRCVAVLRSSLCPTHDPTTTVPTELVG